MDPLEEIRSVYENKNNKSHSTDREFPIIAY